MKHNHFRGAIYQFYSKKQQKNDVDIANSDSELTDSPIQSDSESYYSDIAGMEIDIGRDVSQKICFCFIRRFLKSHNIMNRKKRLLI